VLVALHSRHANLLVIARRIRHVSRNVVVCLFYIYCYFVECRACVVCRTPPTPAPPAVVTTTEANVAGYVSHTHTHTSKRRFIAIKMC
jgi:hypothetical protein